MVPAIMGHDGFATVTRTGRPRLNDKRRHGITARDEILDAAGELFTTTGYAGTSTRAIADAVGIRQASLYHYFNTKEEILRALLSQTVNPTLSFIAHLLSAEPALTAGEHLHALAMFDGRQLLSSRWNLGALYLMPESRGAGVEPFWSDRERLRQQYLADGRAIVAETGIHPAAADLPFRLVESLVSVWSSPPGPERSDLPAHVADACLRMVGFPDSAIPTLRMRSHAELQRYEADHLVTP